MALKLALAIGVVVLMDWLFFTRVGDFFSDFDYRYWPLSKSRVISLIVMMCTVAWMVLFGPRPDPGNPPMWALIPFGIVLIGHIIVGYRDLFRQRRIGYRSPPRYVDRDYY